MDTYLTDRVAIGTGGGQGIGEGIALALAAEGSHVVVVDQNQATAEAAASRIRALGRKALAFQVDVSAWDQVRTMLDRVAAEFGRVDILVNNAGISPKKDGRKILVHEISLTSQIPETGTRTLLSMMTSRTVGSSRRIASLSAGPSSSGSSIRRPWAP